MAEYSSTTFNSKATELVKPGFMADVDFDLAQNVIAIFSAVNIINGDERSMTVSGASQSREYLVGNIKKFIHTIESDPSHKSNSGINVIYDFVKQNLKDVASIEAVAEALKPLGRAFVDHTSDRSAQASGSHFTFL